MRLDHQIVHLVDGRLFDAESYELTSVDAKLTQGASGYYLLLRRRDGGRGSDVRVAGFVGPFVSEACATLAISELEAPDAAIEGEDTAAVASPNEEEATS